MAQFALTALGTAVGGPVGGAIGSFVGAYIDSQIAGALFPGDSPEGPKVEDFRFNQVSEFAPVYKTIGPFNRVPGTYIWLSERQEKTIEQDVGGKGGGGEAITTTNYFFDMAVSCGEAPTAGVSAMLKVWGNSKVLWGFNENRDITSNSFVVTVSDEYEDDGVTFLRRRMRITSPVGDPKVNKFKSGVDATITNFPQAANNGTFRVLKAKKETSSGDTYVELENNSAVAGNAAPNAVNIVQGLPQLQANGAADFVFYDGAETQTPSPLIEAAEGVGLVPAYRGTAYFTLERLLCNQFGNIPPQISALVEEAPARTDAEAVTRIMSDGGFGSSEYDVTEIGDDSIDGYQVRGPTEIKSQLHPVMIKADLLAQDRSGVLHFFYRAAAPLVEVLSDDLAAHEVGRDAARPMEITDITGRDLPTVLDVRYLDAIFNYQSGSARAQKIDKPYGENVQDINIPIVMLGADAQTIARRLLWVAHANQQRARGFLPPSYLGVQENDRLSFTAFGVVWRILLERVTRGADFLIEWEGLVEVEKLLLLDNSSSDEPTDPEPVGPYVPPEIELHLLDIPPLTSDQAVLSGVYSALAAFDSAAQFLGASVYKSDDLGVNFGLAFEGKTEATIGRTVTAHPTAPSPSYIDRVTTLRIDLFDGTLQSVTKAQSLTGFNVYLWGNEIIAAQDASLVGDGVWDVSTLLRGLFDTRDHMVHTNAGERFVALNAAGVDFQQLSKLNLGEDKQWKAVPNLGEISDFTAKVFAFNSETLRPWSPFGLNGTQVSGGAITITWLRRERTPQGFLAFDVPVEDLDGVGYEVDILDAAEGNQVRTLSASTETATYSDANQVTDFGGTQSTIHVAVYKLSVSVGRGNPRFASITPRQV